MRENKTKIIISDNSALSGLTSIGKLDLLRKVYNSVTVTKEVKEEYEKYDNRILPSWFNVEKVKNKENFEEALKKVHLGEASSIALARETDDAVVILDEDKARKYAISCGLTVIGLAGVIKKALKMRIINDKNDAKKLFTDLAKKNFRITQSIIDDVLGKDSNKDDFEKDKSVIVFGDKSKKVNLNEKLGTMITENLHGCNITELKLFWSRFWAKFPGFIKNILQEVRQTLKGEKNSSEIQRKQIDEKKQKRSLSRKLCK